MDQLCRVMCGTKDVVDINPEKLVVSVGLNGVDDIRVKTRSRVRTKVNIGSRRIGRIIHVRGIRINSGFNERRVKRCRLGPERTSR